MSILIEALKWVVSITSGALGAAAIILAIDGHWYFGAACGVIGAAIMVALARFILSED